MGTDGDPDTAKSTMADDALTATYRTSTELPSTSEEQPSRSSKEAAEGVMALDPRMSAEKSGDGDEPSADDYPKGLPLLFTVLAIILGIFLASLDMVIHQSSPLHTPTPRH